MTKHVEATNWSVWMPVGHVGHKRSVEVRLTHQDDYITMFHGREIDRLDQRMAITAIYKGVAAKRDLDIFKAWLTDTVITSGDHEIMDLGVAMARTRSYAI